ncbi:midasin-like isoform X2 [Uloborus diversus]|nr:midasin-like isoform X2 [Uloborus diversus]
MTEYFELLKIYLCTSLGMHRTSSKFLSILLQIFSLLAEKGFCIPPELEEEAQKSGATKFEDIKSGGFGEGEGTKDVSENIKTEDQLEDTFKEGEEKEEKEEEEKSDIKEEEKGIEMSEDFKGKSYDPEKNTDEDSGPEETEDIEEEDLDQQMGDVDNEFEEKMEEKNWGDDSEDENEDMKETEETGGVTQDQQSEMAAKESDLAKDDSKNKKEKTEEELGANMDDQECATAPDPMINQPPPKDADVHDLPEEMEIVDDDGDYNEDGDENPEEMDESVENEDNVSDDDDDGSKEDSDVEIEEPEMNGKEMSEIEEIEMNDNGKKGETQSVEEDNEEGEDENEKENGDDMLPTQGPDSKEKSLPAPEEVEHGSKGAVDQNDRVQNGSTDAQDSKEQHREGQAEAQNAEDAGHEGRKSSSMTSNRDIEGRQRPKLKPPSENRILAEDSNPESMKQRPVRNQRNLEEHSKSDPDGMAEIYEHVSREEDGSHKAVDTATEQQAAKRPPRQQSHYSDDEEVIEILSSDEEEEPPKATGDVVCRNPKDKAGKRGNADETDEVMEVDEDDCPIIVTHHIARGPDSTIHTHFDLWASRSANETEHWREPREMDLASGGRELSASSDEVWHQMEGRLAYLQQELSEQLRLVLEPTKMSKFKGDYRTGKRLNMRKIIPYIASQYRKDKIWLRRTKPSKREYLIMLALDDSSSMKANQCGQLCYESVALLSQALTLLEAGDLCMISYGETVKQLLSFSEQYSPSVGARILSGMSFQQEKTNLVEMLNWATELMARARAGNHSLMSRETAQLLIILSDGQGVNNYGDVVQKAIRRARDNNIFIIYVIFDNPESKKSILDVQRIISCDPYQAEPYMDSFPFPFYIILRNISDLPKVLGEALRQWFELVTSVER